MAFHTKERRGQQHIQLLDIKLILCMNVVSLLRFIFVRFQFFQFFFVCFIRRTCFRQRQKMHLCLFITHQHSQTIRER